MKSFVYFLFTLLIVVSLSSGEMIDNKVSLIPLEDQKKLDILFHHMMTGDYFSCTLFGNKPMTFQEFQADPWKILSRHMLNPYYFFYLENGWKAWEKYKHSFPSKNFIFTTIPSKAGYRFIILINKPAFAQVFGDNQDIFQKALGQTITAEQILQSFEDGQKTFEEVLKDHEGLVGLVLGYGRDNSMRVYRSEALKLRLLMQNLHPLALHSKREELPNKIQNVLRVRTIKLLQKGTKWNQILQYNDIKVDKKDICKELINLSNQSEFFRKEGIYFPSYLEAPNFSCIKDSMETKQLKQAYGEAMKKAARACKQSSFLKAFLEQYSQ